VGIFLPTCLDPRVSTLGPVGLHAGRSSTTHRQLTQFPSPVGTPSSPFFHFRTVLPERRAAVCATLLFHFPPMVSRSMSLPHHSSIAGRASSLSLLFFLTQELVVRRSSLRTTAPFLLLPAVPTTSPKPSRRARWPLSRSSATLFHLPSSLSGRQSRRHTEPPSLAVERRPRSYAIVHQAQRRHLSSCAMSAVLHSLVRAPPLSSHLSSNPFRPSSPFLAQELL
jgi:hypothetical protein